MFHEFVYKWREEFALITTYCSLNHSGIITSYFFRVMLFENCVFCPLPLQIPEFFVRQDFNHRCSYFINIRNFRQFYDIIIAIII